MQQLEAVPLYQQVKRYILSRIDDGQWSVGQPIPSEHDLCALLSVSRATVVRALTDLVHMGVLERRQGLGTFVAAPKVDHGPFELQSFTEEMAERGLPATARVLECDVALPAEDVRRILRLGPDERVVRVRRIRFADRGEPMGIQEANLPAALVPGLAERAEALRGSLYGLLREDYGLRLLRAVETVYPVMLRAEEARLLNCPRARPAFAVERVTYSEQDRPIELTRSRMRGDRYRYVLELARV
jgi:GntR family transcriptional regulator